MIEPTAPHESVAMDASPPVEQSLSAVIGADFWTLADVPELGLHELRMSDGPVGVRGARLDERDPTVLTPSPSALGCTFDPDLLHRIGRVLGKQAQAKNVDVLLAPVLNLQRDPRGGRNFEMYSAAPLVVGTLGSAFIRGVQLEGVAATAKHFVGNDTETQRFDVDIVCDPVTLREVYLAPFERAVADGVAVVMAAYNSVDGVTMTENALLADVLKNEWGFDGPVLSDWFAARSAASASAGLLDLVMPGPVTVWQGLDDDARQALADKVSRRRHLERQLACWRTSPASDATASDGTASAETTVLLRQAAAAAMVLLRNEKVADGRPALPLPSGATIALIGRGWQGWRLQGAGSAAVTSTSALTPAQALLAAADTDARFTLAAGIPAPEGPGQADLSCFSHGTRPGFQVSYFDHQGKHLHTEQRATLVWDWLGHLAPGIGVDRLGAVELSADFTATHDGPHRFSVYGSGRTRLRVDDQTTEEVARAADVDLVDGVFAPPPSVALTATLRAGQRVAFSVRHVPDGFPGRSGVLAGAAMAVGVLAPQDAAALRDEAVAAATDSDVAVVIVGTDPRSESEGFDRHTLALPAHQDELVRAVAAVNPRTIVVVNSGAPVLLPWLDEVAAVLAVWFPGEQGAQALADVLLGVTEPGGRLAMPWPLADPAESIQPIDGVLRYPVGPPPLTAEPGFAFGDGRGYTTWSLISAVLDRPAEPGGELVVQVELANTGSRPGREVVHLWLHRDGSPSALVGFGSVTAPPGSVSTMIPIARRAVQHWDEMLQQWTDPATELRLIARATSAPDTLVVTEGTP